MKAYLFSSRPCRFKSDESSDRVSGSYLGFLTPTANRDELGYTAFNLYVPESVYSHSDFCIGSLYELDLIPRLKDGAYTLKCVGVIEICS